MTQSLVHCSLAPFPFDAPFFFARSFGSDVVPNTPSIVPASFVFPSRLVARVIFHVDLLLLFATTSCFSTLKVCLIALHKLSAITSEREGERERIVPAALAVFDSTPSRSHPLSFLNLNKRLVAFVSHPLIQFKMD